MTKVIHEFELKGGGVPLAVSSLDVVHAEDYEDMTQEAREKFARLWDERDHVRKERDDFAREEDSDRRRGR